MSLCAFLVRSVLSGVIQRDSVPKFDLILWRALRGNLYRRFADIDEHILDSATVRLRAGEGLVRACVCVHTSADATRAACASRHGQ